MREIREIKWSGDEIKRFLKIYRTHPCLWDNNSLHYLNREVKKVAFQNILTKLDESGLPIEEDQLRKKIKSIRDTYRAELNKVIKSFKSGIVYYPKLTWYGTADAFLNAPVTGRQLSSKLDSTTVDNNKNPAKTELEEGVYEHFTEEDGTDNSFMDEDADTPFTADDTDGPFTEAVSTSHMNDYANELLGRDQARCSSLPSLFTTTTNRKRCGGETSSGLRSAKRTVSTIYTSDEDLLADDKGPTVARPEEDQYNIFAKHVAAQLRELPMRSFVLLQCQIQDVITKERLKQLDAANSQ